MFACDKIACAHGAEYGQLSTVNGQIFDEMCLPFPDSCQGQPSCGCVDDCGNCSESSEGDISVSCAGETDVHPVSAR